MTSSFQKIYGFAVQTKTQRRRFQMYPLWDPVSKNTGFTRPKRRIPCGRKAYPIKKINCATEKNKISEICCFPLKRDWIVQAPLIGTQPISNHIQLSAKDFMTFDWIEVQYTHTHRVVTHRLCVWEWCYSAESIFSCLCLYVCERKGLNTVTQISWILFFLLCTLT